MRKFRDILLESKGQIVFTFGEFNPPTTGHEKLIQRLHLLVVLIHIASIHLIHKMQKDPLPTLSSRIHEKDVSKHRGNIIASKDGRTGIQIAEMLYKEGFTDWSWLLVLIGSKSFLLYSIVIMMHQTKELISYLNLTLFKYYRERDPDAEGVEGMSASKMRAGATVEI